jgi:hypothetical protein
LLLWPDQDYNSPIHLKEKNMQSGQQIKIDQPGLMKVGLPLVIIGAVAGLLWIVGVLGGLLGILAWIVLAGAGWRYADVALKDGKQLTLVDAAVNGAIIGAVVGVAYGLGMFIGQMVSGCSVLGVRFECANFFVIVSELVSGAVSGAIGAAAWTAYKGGMFKTK